MKPELPKIDDYIQIFGRQWDCKNIVSITRWIDNIQLDDNRLVVSRYYLECHETSEAMQIDEFNLMRILECAGGPIIREFEEITSAPKP